MKKLIAMLTALMIMVCSAAMAETIAPQFTGVNTTEATYSVGFNRDDIKDGVMNNVTIYTEDVYDIAEVSKMAVGDTFEAAGKTITVETMETDEYGHININGGYDTKEGYTLRPQDEDEGNGWTTLLDDDFCTYTDRGVFNLELAENVTFTDYRDMTASAIFNGEEAPSFTGIEAVTKAIAESKDDSFYANNAEIRIEGGKVVEITRRYVP